MIEKRARELCQEHSMRADVLCRSCLPIAAALQSAHDAGAAQERAKMKALRTRVEVMLAIAESMPQEPKLGDWNWPQIAQECQAALFHAPAQSDLAERYRRLEAAARRIIDKYPDEWGGSELDLAIIELDSTPAAPSAAAPHCDECDPGPCKHFEAMLKACKQVEEKKP